MSSKWKEWVQEWVSKEVLGVQCGEITRVRTLKLNASHGGKSCEEQFNCTSDCYKDQEDKVCPGMCQLESLWDSFVIIIKAHSDSNQIMFYGLFFRFLRNCWCHWRGCCRDHSYCRNSLCGVLPQEEKFIQCVRKSRSYITRKDDGSIVKKSSNKQDHGGKCCYAYQRRVWKIIQIQR